MRKIGEKKLIYANVPVDENGWVNAKEYMPPDFVLCLLKIKGNKSKAGWANGLNWDGYGVNEKDEVLFWKKHREKKEN